MFPLRVVQGARRTSDIDSFEATTAPAVVFERVRITTLWFGESVWPKEINHVTYLV